MSVVGNQQKQQVSMLVKTGRPISKHHNFGCKGKYNNISFHTSYIRCSTTRTTNTKLIMTTYSNSKHHSSRTWHNYHTWSLNGCQNLMVRCRKRRESHKDGDDCEQIQSPYILCFPIMPIITCLHRC